LTVFSSTLYFYSVIGCNHSGDINRRNLQVFWTGVNEMPISDSLRAQIGEYLIGQKLRALRLRRSMGLLQLGQRTGLSAALLSKIENCKLVPTIPTLLRIALALDVTLDHFFRNEQSCHLISLTRKEEREQLTVPPPTAGDSYVLTRLDAGTGERKFHPYLAEFLPLAKAEAKPHTHLGFEFIHVLRGTLRLLLGNDEQLMHAGDSIYFDSNLRHSYRCISEERCVAFMVLAYPERNLAERRADNLELHSIRRKPFTLVSSPVRSEPSRPGNGHGLPQAKLKHPSMP
jgi:quercetin dioxygenase-like cupin family protein/DNA-binding Xre family transcriptional regulator